ncbi:hypothetical protein QOZ88_00395 [Blastococcus sp. BMG 814]|uniref:Uncharacterized protein n=1 Tax=Blastococcus carthaginiensis TaxID=3050034 RepID=A0ABT9I689_9ACTN|nr:hypothetical protein [Blastococcus carthaginiensis]MDP5181085.1 hypothetical protein [Blastococcus carthaginiensis]
MTVLDGGAVGAAERSAGAVRTRQEDAVAKVLVVEDEVSAG